jgi:UDP-glucose 6-dehydrogenase
MKAAILGYGFVGKATEQLLIDTEFDIVIQDPALGLKIDDWTDVEYVFICVPTPLYATSFVDENGSKIPVCGRLELRLVDNAIRSIPTCPNGKPPRIVIRSTIGPDQLSADWLFMPEFLREIHWAEDVANKDKSIIIGGHGAAALGALMPKGRQVKIVTAKAAAIFKLSRNAMLAAKVIMANEIKEVCETYQVDYETVKELFIVDGTLGTTHFDVPGPDGKSGFGGKCLPKDTEHFAGLLPSTDRFSAVNIFNTTVIENQKYRK